MSNFLHTGKGWLGVGVGQKNRGKRRAEKVNVNAANMCRRRQQQQGMDKMLGGSFHHQNDEEN
jgi:hypothetical protein